MTEPLDQKDRNPQQPLRSDEDFAKLGNKHPYMVYLILVGGLFLFLLLMGYLAISNNWIPSRGISQ